MLPPYFPELKRGCVGVGGQAGAFVGLGISRSERLVTGVLVVSLGFISGQMTSASPMLK